jgi:uncharacterized membrane protein YphA (DoxX/SURF4 family)
VLRLGLGALFIVAGTLKLRDPVAFASEITNYRLLSSLAGYLAAGLPMVELVLGAALLLAPAPWRRAAALASASLLAVFTVAVAQVVARHINIDCGCFGSSSGPVDGWTIARDVALLLGACALFALTPLTSSPWAPRRESPA